MTGAAEAIHVPRERVRDLLVFPSVVVSHARPLAIAVALSAVAVSLIPGLGGTTAICVLAAAAIAVLIALHVGDSRMETEDLDHYIAAAGRANGAETLPVVLVDPFEAVREDRRPRLLDALVLASTHTQIIAVTDDVEVIGVARLLEIAGSLAVEGPSLHHRATLDDVVSSAR